MSKELPAVDKKPTVKQQAFIDAYLRCWNGTRAAIEAGYSETSARSTASTLLTYPNISSQIQERIDENAMSADEALLEMASIARGDITDLMAIGHTGFTIELLDENNEIVPAAKNIKKIKQRVTTIQPRTEDGEEKEIIETEIELYDRKDALKTILQHHGQLNQKIELTGKDGERLIPDDRYDRAISTLSDVLRESISGKSAE